MSMDPDKKMESKPIARPRRKPPLVPGPRDGALPLSFAQERFWLIAQYDAKHFAYNEPFFVRIEGPLNVLALERSLVELVRRHEILRTTFAEVDGQLVQRIAPAIAFEMPVEGLDALPERDQASAVRQRAMEEVRRPFDLERGALVRARLLRVAADEHMLLVVMHHIICDGWSIGIVEHELNLLYDAFSRGEDPGLPALPVQYADYARWQREWLTQDMLQGQLEFWKRQLAGAPPALELPTDRPRPQVQTFEGTLLEVELPLELAAGIRALSRKEGVTLYMTTLAAFYVLLSRYSHQSDIVVGSPVAGRNHSKVEGLIGCFVNTLAMRVQLPEGESFRGLLMRVREVWLDAEAHQDLPFESLVNALQAGRDPSRTPIFQVMFEFQGVGFSLRLPGLSVSELAFDPGVAKFDLTVLVRDTADVMRCVWEYNTALFDRATVERMGAHYLSLLGGAVASPEQPLSRLALLNEEERRRILVGWNATRRALPLEGSIPALFEQQVDRTPDELALIHREERLSFRELNTRANQLAHRLRALGVAPEVLVGILMERSVDMVVALLGVLKAGGAYLPLDPAYPPKRLAYMLEDSRAPVLLTQRRLLDMLPAYGGRVLCVDQEREAFRGESPSNPAPLGTPDNLAYVIYTSGSTGRPKGVMITHRAVSNLRFAFHDVGYSDLRPPVRVGLNSSFSFDASVQQIIQLTNGHTLCLVPSEAGEDMGALMAFLDRERVGAIECSPAQLRLMLEAGFGQAPGGTTSRVIVGGEAIDEPLWAQLVAHPYITFFNLYGPTECTVDVCCCVIRGYAGGPSLGRPLANCRAYVLDGRMEPVPVGVSGELYIGGVQLARGYWNVPDLTADRFVPDPFSAIPGARLYRTGDLARYRADGTLEFQGRTDDQVKVRGFRIELGEVETALKQISGVSDAAVVARQFAPGDKRLVAYVVGPGLDASTLRVRIKEELPRHMVPSALVLLERLPLTPNGKVDRKALPVPDDTRFEPSRSVMAPRNALELQLVRDWEEVLGTRPIGVRDNFFELGGHSLLAIRLLTRVKDRFGQHLPAKALLQHPTVEGLASILRQEAPPWSPLVELWRGGEWRRPFFCVHPVGGNVLCYAELASLMAPDQPFYGLQARGCEGEQEPCDTIEGMAALYLDAIRTLQPRGPYLLGGWSMGGSIAFEMAQQLKRQGEQVGLLVLIDSYASPSPGEQASAEQRDLAESAALFYEDVLQTAGQKLPLPEGELRRLEPGERLRALREAASAEMGLQPLEALRRVFESNLRAAWRYAPQPYEGPLIVLEAADAPGPRGWERLARPEPAVHRIQGDHHSILRRPHVEEVATRLRMYLDEVQVALTAEPAASEGRAPAHIMDSIAKRERSTP